MVAVKNKIVIILILRENRLEGQLICHESVSSIEMISAAGSVKLQHCASTRQAPLIEVQFIVVLTEGIFNA